MGSGPSIAAASLFMFVAALAFSAPAHPAWDGVIYERGARHIAEGGGFTQRILRESAPPRATAFYPVGTSFYLATGRWLGGERGADRVLQALAVAACVALTGSALRRAGYPHEGARAAWLVALQPAAWLYGASWLSEPLSLALVALVAAASMRAPTTPRSRFALNTAAGLAAAASSLVRPVNGLIAAAAFLVLRGSSERDQRWRWLDATTFALVTALALAPWAARNQTALGSPVVVSTNGGANLLVGTVRATFGHIPAEIDCPHALSEIERDRCRRGVARSRIAAAPLGWLGLGVAKLAHTFAYDASAALLWVEATSLPWVHRGGTVERLAILATTLGYWGLLLAAANSTLRRRAPRALVVALGVSITLVALVHFTTLGGDRYHAALAPLLAMVGAFAFSTPGASRIGRQT